MVEGRESVPSRMTGWEMDPKGPVVGVGFGVGRRRGDL